MPPTRSCAEGRRLEDAGQIGPGAPALPRGDAPEPGRSGRVRRPRAADDPAPRRRPVAVRPTPRVSRTSGCSPTRAAPTPTPRGRSGRSGSTSSSGGLRARLAAADGDAGEASRLAAEADAALAPGRPVGASWAARPSSWATTSAPQPLRAGEPAELTTHWRLHRAPWGRLMVWVHLRAEDRPGRPGHPIRRRLSRWPASCPSSASPAAPEHPAADHGARATPPLDGTVWSPASGARRRAGGSIAGGAGSCRR